MRVHALTVAAMSVSVTSSRMIEFCFSVSRSSASFNCCSNSGSFAYRSSAAFCKSYAASACAPAPRLLRACFAPALSRYPLVTSAV